jgi:hypothetical protein
MLVFSVLWMFEVNSSMRMRQVELAAAAFVARCAVTWCYWTGWNWARLMAIFYSAFALARLFQIRGVTGLTRELWLAEAALGAFLFFYLQQKHVNAWFTRAEVARTPTSCEPKMAQPEFPAECETADAVPPCSDGLAL